MQDVAGAGVGRRVVLACAGWPLSHGGGRRGGGGGGGIEKGGGEERSDRGGEIGMSQTPISRIWWGFGHKPSLRQTWKLSSDPEFIAKVRDIAGL